MTSLTGTPAALPARNPAVLFQTVSGGAVLLNMQQEVYFSLNEVGAQVWELLPPVSADLSDVCDKLAARYPDVDAEVLRTDISELLAALEAEGLVVPAGQGA